MTQPARIDAVEIDGVLTVVPPRGTPSPMVFDSPHSGLMLPEDFHPAVPPGLVHIAADTHVDALFDFAPDLGAPFLVAHFPRSFLDVNRSLLDVDLELVEGDWPHPVRDSASARRGMGLIWRYAWGDAAMYDRRLTVAEVEARIERYWRPYHDRLKALLDAVHGAFGRVYHVNCHSMPAIGHALSPDPAGTVRPDFVLGDYDGASCEPGFVRLAAETLRGLGYSVSLNVPFRGAELVSAYSDPARGRHSLQIEINRRLYMDEDSRERTAGFAALRGHLEILGRALRNYAANGGVEA
ncbi:N-formylglutamate amidohydrolase [Inquilinus limosus]|uniref:N-formylglutamate amidohydrolase n=1 Tax=Inquilinus limosus TaxID=171674 RepID=UPI000400B917|nr:N-formylglutamate amidohydrolase [Inquilinus limosus]